MHKGNKASGLQYGITKEQSKQGKHGMAHQLRNYRSFLCIFAVLVVTNHSRVQANLSFSHLRNKFLSVSNINAFCHEPGHILQVLSSINGVHGGSHLYLAVDRAN